MEQAVNTVFRGNRQIAWYERVDVLPSGALECRDYFGGPVQAILAPGLWDHVVMEAPTTTPTTVEELQQALFDVYVALGGDTDGIKDGPTFARIVSPFPALVVDDARRYREENDREDDELLTELESARRKLAALRTWVQDNESDPDTHVTDYEESYVAAADDVKRMITDPEDNPEGTE